MSGAKGTIGEILGAIFLLAVLYMLVRPSSDGPAIIQAVTGAFNALVLLATTGGTKGE